MMPHVVLAVIWTSGEISRARIERRECMPTIRRAVGGEEERVTELFGSQYKNGKRKVYVNAYGKLDGLELNLMATALYTQSRKKDMVRDGLSKALELYGPVAVVWDAS